MPKIREANAVGKVAEEASASEVKNAWHSYLEHVRLTRNAVVITRYGRPIAKLVPIEPTLETGGLVGCLRGTVTEHGDLIAPTGAKWSADA